MGQRKTPPKAKLIIGILLRNALDFEPICRRLTEKFGPIDEILAPFSFVATNFYADELGEKPWRAFVAFDCLVARDELAAAKIWTQGLEREGITQGLRSYNLDPGIVTLGQLFLATTKDQRQRVYVGEGIYIEPTLYFQNHDWRPFEWTYKDYRDGDYFGFLKAVREKLHLMLKVQGVEARPLET